MSQVCGLPFVRIGVTTEGLLLHGIPWPTAVNLLATIPPCHRSPGLKRVAIGYATVLALSLVMKHAAERCAGKPPATFDAEGAGNVMHPYC